MSKADTRHEICNNVAKHSAKLQASELRGPIYPIYKEILLEAIRPYTADTQLPSVRDLSKSFNVSLVTAQRIINELVSDGVLYSRPRSGVFIAGSSPLKKDNSKTTENTHNTIPSSFESHFSFGTTSALPFQRILWEKLVENFQSKYPNNRLNLQFYTDQDTDTLQLDAYERLDWNVGWSGNQNPTLNLQKNTSGAIKDLSTPEGLLPLYYRSNFLFYNQDILEECGIPEPHYHDFESQLKYLNDACKPLAAHGYEPLAYSSQQPITLFGCDNLELYFSLIYSNEDDNEMHQAYIEAVKSTLRLSKLKQKGPEQDYALGESKKKQYLAGGRNAFYYGHSVDFWSFQHKPKSFNAKCYPMISSDNSLFMWPMVGAINYESKRPIESIRFLSYLISEPAQQEFINTGAYPADPQSESMPTTTMPATQHHTLLKNSHPMRLALPEHYYLAINVLNNELWHAALNHSSEEDAATEAIHMGKIFASRH